MGGSFGGTVKLTGESEYKKALSEISSNLKVLNSEMKSVTSQYDKNDQSVENLSSQSDVLNKKFEEQKNKVKVLKDALADSKKETGENSETTKKWQTELNNAQADLNKLNRELGNNSKALAEAENKEGKTTSGLKGFAKTLLECGAGTKSLGSEIKGGLTNRLDNLKDSVGGNITKVKDFASGVGNIVSDMKQMGIVAGLSVAALKLFGDEMDETGVGTEATAGDVEDFGEEAEKSGEKALSMGDIIKANLISDAIKGGLSALAEGIKGVGAKFGEFLALGEETKEMQTSMAKLEASFESAGLDIDYANDSMYELTGVLGDTGKATEASMLLAKMSKNGEDLATNTRILTGVFAEYGDSIPTEGLAEAMAATSSMGSVQGVLADALEWQGVNLDEYNEKLAKMSTEEERAAYIQQSLTDIYGASADAYREQNQALIESNEAQLRYEQWLAHIGSLATPIQTDIKNMSSTLMQGFAPALQTVMPGVQGLTGAFGNLLSTVVNGGNIDGAMSDMSEAIFGFVQGIGDALPQVMEIASSMLDTFLEMIERYLPYLIEEGAKLLGTLLSGIATSLDKIMPVVLSVIQTLINVFLQNLPMLIEMGIQMLMSLIQGISSNLPKILEMATKALMTLIQGIASNLPMILEMGIQMIVSLVEGIALMLPELIPLAINAVLNLVDTLIDNLDLIIDAGIELIMALVDGLLDALPDLVQKIPLILDKLVEAVFNNLDKILDAGIEVTLAIADGLVDALPQLLEKLPQIIGKIVSGLVECLPQLISAGGDLLAGLFKGLLNPSTILKSIKGLKDGIIKAVKEMFGIHSPSTVFRDEIGDNLALGLGEGFTDTMADVSKAMGEAIPTEFDTDINANMNVASAASQMSTYDMMVSAFKQALTEVKVVMDDREMGGFVTNTVERVVFA